jgi:hypothetical protein
MSTSADPTLTDAELVASCAAVIDEPKAAAPDSFVLHAPLELLARALLLDRVHNDEQPRARERLQWLADNYASAGPSAESTPDVGSIPMDDLVVSLAAAGHAPILLSLRDRVDAVDESFGTRLMATEVARYPDWVLTWPRARPASGRSSGDLAARLAAPRSPGDPGSDFIFPVMHLADSSGLAAEVLEDPLRGMNLDDARRTLLRVSARSMLQDDPAAAAYQWTHCQTMSQAVLDTVDQGADPDVAIGVAATYVLGFRSVFGRVRLDDEWRPVTDSEAGRIWTASDDELPAIEADLATFGAIHPDAHVAKYTLACLDAAADDEDERRLHLAAAAHLHDWWRDHPVVDDPILDATG